MIKLLLNEFKKNYKISNDKENSINELTFDLIKFSFNEISLFNKYHSVILIISSLLIAINNVLGEEEDLKFNSLINNIFISKNLNDNINIIKNCKNDILQLINENKEEEEEIEICLTRENSSKSIYDNFLFIDSENENN
jgi:hypothetical protein